ncbi:MAG TPA: alpha/beta hydrolase [Parafilimonas sp.]|nr:alpha/beta hydrolase [Parafilimonas sp.]
MKLLFFPGGPGFNSNPEIQLLKTKYVDEGIDFIGWHEPSVFRTNGDVFTAENAFKNYLQSAETFFRKNFSGEPLTIFGFCFGSYPVKYLLREHADKIKFAIIATPDFCLPRTDKNIFIHVMNDYKQHNDIRAEVMKEILDNYPSTFDENMERGFRLAAENPNLFHYYWQNDEQMQNFVQYYNGKYQIDVEGFLAVRRTMFEINLKKCKVPVTVIYGKHDKIISISDELKKIPELFSNCSLMEMERSSHYPHIEQAEEVLAHIQKELRKKP